jgi:hypothetical protein
MEADTVSKMTNRSQSVINLGMFWRCRVRETFGDDKQLTPKEFGQLKMLARYLGAITTEVIDRTIDNWKSFCHQARAEAALPSAPTTPHIGFLLAHAGTAANLMYSIAKNREPKGVGDLDFIKMMDDMFEQQKKEWATEESALEETG